MFVASACGGSTRNTERGVPAGAAARADPWTVAIDEQFNGTRLDSSRWSTCYWWSSTTCTNAPNHEQQLYTPNNVQLVNGQVHLEARRQNATAEDGKTYNYTSGIITGTSPHGTMAPFTYGYVEARIHVPPGSGLWSALWMLPADRSVVQPEIDIFEIVGETPHLAYQSLHIASQRQPLRHVEKTDDDLSGGWHVYGLDWQPSRLIWYIDGRETWTVTRPDAVPHVPMYLLANLAVGGDFPTRVTPETPFPSSMDIDYIRVWQRH